MMDSKGFLTDTIVRIVPSRAFVDYLYGLERSDDMPTNIRRFIKNKANPDSDDRSYLYIDDLKWISKHLEVGSGVYLHELMAESELLLPENETIERNPELEARCVKLRNNQLNRDYRAMTKNVDNVRIKQPEDSVAYQLKNLNKQLIAVFQFVLSIAAGFLFGFTGVQLILGNLDFGFRLLLGVMCALIIALAEIYFLAKKLNEDYMITETVQLGGPTTFKNKPHSD